MATVLYPASKIGDQSPRGPWKRQFDPVFDFPQIRIEKRFILCTTPRCGSHFLGHQLQALGCFGYPLEYFNGGNWTTWQNRAAAAGCADTLDFIKSVRTGPGGVFASKLHHEHLAFFLTLEKNPLSYRYIHLKRKNLLGQAVSFARAQQTGAWISDMPGAGQGIYDRDLIARKVNAISQGNANWTSFLTSTGIDPLEIYYEDIIADPKASVDLIADFLKIKLSVKPAATSSFSPARQQSAKGGQNDWAERFARECRAQLATGRPVPGAPGERPAARLRGRVRTALKSAVRRSGLINRARGSRP